MAKKRDFHAQFIGMVSLEIMGECNVVGWLTSEERKKFLLGNQLT